MIINYNIVDLEIRNLLTIYAFLDLKLLNNFINS